MTKKILVAFFVFALAVASAAGSYNITLFQPSTVAGKDLKAGDYKLTIENGKAILSQGKSKVEASVKTETSDTKFSSTSVRYSTADGKSLVKEIRLGGTTTRVVFDN
ncbi:MAG: hypothetical protein IT161_21915 [Bryobacterales bacterium]|nr:hypothetical protein [Bryobacterales bacterium]